MAQRTCSVEGCDKPHYARSWCQGHYDALRQRRTCAVEGCDKPVKGRGWCAAHHKRWRLWGCPEGVAPERTSSITTKGYRRIKVPGHPACEKGTDWALEHRVVAWDAYGELPPGTVVHHRNHDRLDNRLENLEVLTISEHRRAHRALDWSRAADLYRSGSSISEIARLIGTNPGTVSRTLERDGVHSPRRRGGRS